MKSTRRDFLSFMGITGTAVLAGFANTGIAETESGGFRPGEHTLPELPYPYDALEPVLSTSILEIHHDKHHAGYVKGLNRAEMKLAEMRETGDYSMITHWERELAFHGSGHYLHSLYWDSLSPGGGGEPSLNFLKAINESFGSMTHLQKQLAAASGAVEASGWGVLAYHPWMRRLVVLQDEKHQNLTIWGAAPILVIDVWEHAYYLQYENRRMEYIENLMGILDWEGASKRYEALSGSNRNRKRQSP